ncbi:MAG: PA14 domain-containing protein, partial [Acidobacteria bacterium]|nr:PA14 domain-containing protein [Acidobacteriota bacterium]
ARWTRIVTFGEGVFRFTVTADDGVRIYIDRQLKFERWVDQTATHTFDVQLNAGNHLITVEYFERWGSAALKLSWEQHPCLVTVSPDHWRGEYFNNVNLSGRPAIVRDDGEGFLDFDWGSQSPGAGCNVNGDDFSVRWSRKVILGAGSYRFAVTGDDGVRLFIDGRKVIDQWRNQKRSTFEATIYLAPGSHRLVLEFYDHTGEAVVNLSWQ